MVEIENVVNLAAIFLLIVFWLMAFVVLYHLARFGVGVLPKKLSVIFLVGALGIFTWCIVTYIKLDLSSIRL